MKKTLLLTSLLLAMTVSVALAGGVNLNWGTSCYTNVPTPTTFFACNVNTSVGNRTMTTSWMIDDAMGDLIALEWAIEGQSDAAALPDWWKIGALVTDCRVGKATFNSNYTAYEDEICVDWTAGQGYVAPQYIWDTNKAHITCGVAISAATPYAALSGQEYFGGGWTVLNSKTVGTGACTGCSIGMIFNLPLLTVVGLDGRRTDIREVIPGGSQCCIWNLSVQPCMEPVPARNTTWGQVKSLYR